MLTVHNLSCYIISKKCMLLNRYEKEDTTVQNAITFPARYDSQRCALRKVQHKASI